jgi:hypothetical protein
MNTKRSVSSATLLISLVVGSLLTLIIPFGANAGPFSRPRPPKPRPAPLPSAAPKVVNSIEGKVFVGIVRSDAGNLYRFEGSSAQDYGVGASWDTCPEKTILIGHDFQSNGFWLCVSSDVAKKTYHFGNVVSNEGNYYEVSGGRARKLGYQSWDKCFSGKLRGRVFDSRGFWFCQE